MKDEHEEEGEWVPVELAGERCIRELSVRRAGGRRSNPRLHLRLRSNTSGPAILPQLAHVNR